MHTLLRLAVAVKMMIWWTRPIADRRLKVMWKNSHLSNIWFTKLQCHALPNAWNMMSTCNPLTLCHIFSLQKLIAIGFQELTFMVLPSRWFVVAVTLIPTNCVVAGASDCVGTFSETRKHLLFPWQTTGPSSWMMRLKAVIMAVEVTCAIRVGIGAVLVECLSPHRWRWKFSRAA